MTKEIVSDFSRLIQSKLYLYPSIYVTCLAVHEKGIAYGKWINADQPVERLNFAIQSVLAQSPVPKSKAWIITKSKGFGEIQLDQLANVEAIHYFASFFAEYGKLGVMLLRYLNSSEGDKIAEARELFENNYHGAFESEAHFVKSRFVEIEDVDSVDISNYQTIADESFAKHFFSLVVGGAVHVFDKVKVNKPTA